MTIEYFLQEENCSYDNAHDIGLVIFLHDLSGDLQKR